MIGFVCAISASLAIIILITISSLLGYINSVIPKEGLLKISEFHYNYTMDNVFIQASVLAEMTLAIDSLELSNDFDLKYYRAGCNYGFNRVENEMTEIATFNFVRIHQFYGDQVNVEPVEVRYYDEGINTCYIDVYFEKLKGINNG
jgi:hypothetical protein